MNNNKHSRSDQKRIDQPYIQDINKQCLFRLMMSQHRYGYISLKSLSTWNSVFLAEKTFFYKKQYGLVDNEFSIDSLPNYMKSRLHKKGIDVTTLSSRREELNNTLNLYRQAIVNGEINLLKELEHIIETKHRDFSKKYQSTLNVPSNF